MEYQINASKFLDKDEQVQLINTLGQKLSGDPTRYLPILMALRTGCRKSELLLMKVGSLNFKTGVVFIKATKNSHDREIPLEPQFLQALKLYIQRAHLESGDQLFKTSKTGLFRIWKEVAPSNKKFHSLRHTFAINLFKAHKDINLVKIALGHKSIDNTMVYVQYLYATEELSRLLVQAQVSPEKSVVGL